MAQVLFCDVFYENDLQLNAVESISIILCNFSSTQLGFFTAEEVVRDWAQYLCASE